MGRAAVRLRDLEAERGACHRGGYHRLVPGQPGPFQGAARRGVRAVAQDLDRQDPEIRAARTGQGPGGGRVTGDGFDLTGRVAVVTGASSGLGRHFALILARAGAKVAVAARRLPKLEDLAAEIAGFDGRALPVALDVTDAGSGAAALEAVETPLRPIHIPVNNPRVPATPPFPDPTPHQWRPP